MNGKEDRQIRIIHSSPYPKNISVNNVFDPNYYLVVYPNIFFYLFKVMKCYAIRY